MSIRHAIKWSFLAELASKVVTPVVFVVLARLLTPKDFGVVAAASMVISFSQIFWEAGLGKAFIQYQGDRDVGANAAFWVNNALGIVVAASLIGIAPLLADNVFHDSRVSPVLRVMSLQVFLSALASIHTALLRKDLQFKRLFWVRLLTTGVPGLTSIPLAMLGMGYWALVAGTLVGQIMQVLVLWRMSEWRPSFGFDKEVALRLGRFGTWVAVTGLMSWFYLWADSLFVGMYLGAHELGLYRTGNMFVVMIYGFLFNPLLPVLYSHLAQIQHDSENVKRVLNRVVRSVTFLSIPIAFGLYSFSGAIEAAVFSDQWKDIGVVIAIMALGHGFAWIVGMNGEAYRAIGRPDYETKVMGASMLVYTVAYVLSIQHGFAVFLWTKCCLTLFGIAVHFGLAHRTLDFPVTRTLSYVAKVSVSGIPLFLASWYFRDDAVSSTALVALLAASCSSLVYLWLLERKSLVPETLDLLRRTIRPRTG